MTLICKITEKVNISCQSYFYRHMPKYDNFELLKNDHKKYHLIFYLYFKVYTLNFYNFLFWYIYIFETES